MKILKEGKKFFDAKARVTCERCEAELEIVRTDLTKCPEEPGKPTLYVAVCPCCDKRLFFTVSELTGIF